MKHALSIAAIIALAILPASTAGQVAKKPAAVAKPAAKKAPAKPAAKKKSGPSKDERFGRLLFLIENQNKTITDCASARQHAGTAISVDVFENEAEKSLDQKFTKLNLEKDEYVTSAEHYERVNTIVSGFFGDTDLGVFITPVPQERMTYNADQGRLFVRPISFDRNATTTITTWEKEKKLSTQKGQTRMGIPFTYEVWAQVSEKLALDTRDAMSYARPTASIASTPVEAKALKSNLRYLFFGSLQRPFHDVAEDEEMASLDSPYLIMSSVDTYYMKPECAVLFDTVTKTVYETYYVGDVPAAL